MDTNAFKEELQNLKSLHDAGFIDDLQFEKRTKDLKDLYQRTGHLFEPNLDEADVSQYQHNSKFTIIDQQQNDSLPKSRNESQNSKNNHNGLRNSNGVSKSNIPSAREIDQLILKTFSSTSNNDNNTGLRFSLGVENTENIENEQSNQQSEIESNNNSETEFDQENEEIGTEEEEVEEVNLEEQLETLKTSDWAHQSSKHLNTKLTRIQGMQFKKKTKKPKQKTSKKANKNKKDDSIDDLASYHSSDDEDEEKQFKGIPCAIDFFRANQNYIYYVGTIESTDGTPFGAIFRLELQGTGYWYDVRAPGSPTVMTTHSHCRTQILDRRFGTVIQDPPPVSSIDSNYLGESVFKPGVFIKRKPIGFVPPKDSKLNIEQPKPQSEFIKMDYWIQAKRKPTKPIMKGKTPIHTKTNENLIEIQAESASGVIEWTDSNGRWGHFYVRDQTRNLYFDGIVDGWGKLSKLRCLSPLEENWKEKYFIEKPIVLNGREFRNVNFEIKGHYEDMLLTTSDEVKINTAPTPTPPAPTPPPTTTTPTPNPEPIPEKREKISESDFENEIEMHLKAAIENTHKLWVGNLPNTMTKEKCESLFSPFGKIQSIQFIARAKIFAFIRYYKAIDGVKAHSKMHKFQVEGNSLMVNFAQNQ